MRQIQNVKGLDYVKGITAFKNNSLRAMESFQKDYGDLPYFGGPLKTLFVFHPDDIKKNLVDEKHNNEKGDQARLLLIVVGKSLFISEGEEWRKKKAIIQKVFHHQTIFNYSPLIAHITHQYVEKWKKEKTVNLSDEIMSLSFKISSEIFFGGMSDEENIKLRHAFSRLGKIIAKKFSSPIKLPWSIPTADHLELRDHIAQIDQSIYALIKRSRENNINSTSFLGRLINSEDRLSDQEIRNEVVTFMSAGYETTGTFIIWTLYLLLKNPEAIEIFKKAPKYSKERRHIMQEGLRLYPSFPINVRQNIDPIELESGIIPKRTNLLFSPFITHRDPHLWEDPLKFNPERYERIESDVLRSQFIPFLIGPKKCIGEQLAYEEGETVLETILQNANLKLITKELTPIADILLYSDVPLVCQVD